MELPLIKMDNTGACFSFLLGGILAIRNLAFRHVKFVMLSVLLFCATKQITTNLMAHNNTCYHTVSVRAETPLLGSLCFGVSSCNQGMGWAWVLICGLDWRRILFQLHSGCWQNSFCCSCRTESFSFLLAGGHPHILEVICNSLPCGPPHKQFTAWQPAPLSPVRG